ncbi:MAG: CRISPR-associated endonuclease Cas1 [bacterium JZ-2024 1]
MSTLYILQDGALLKREGERFKVVAPDENQNFTTILDIPLIKVDQIVIFGHCTITPPALDIILDNNIDVAFLSRYGRYKGRLQPEISTNAPLRKIQILASENPDFSLRLCKSIVAGKIANMRTLLLRSARDLPDEHPQTPHKKETLDAAADSLKQSLHLLSSATTVTEVRGYEGQASAIYFSAFPSLLKSHDFTFNGRVKYPATDPVNALLSLAYVLLTNEIHAACNIVGLDAYIGYLHADRHGKPSLALDLVEEWRPVIADSLVLNCINKKVIQLDDFTVEPGNVYRLHDYAFKKFLQQYEEKKRSEIKHPILGDKIPYFKCFEIQVRFLAKFLQSEISEYTPFLIK